MAKLGKRKGQLFYIGRSIEGKKKQMFVAPPNAIIDWSDESVKEYYATQLLPGRRRSEAKLALAERMCARGLITPMDMEHVRRRLALIIPVFIVDAKDADEVASAPTAAAAAAAAAAVAATTAAPRSAAAATASAATAALSSSSSAALQVDTEVDPFASPTLDPFASPPTDLLSQDPIELELVDPFA